MCNFVLQLLKLNIYALLSISNEKYAKMHCARVPRESYHNIVYLTLNYFYHLCNNIKTKKHLEKIRLDGPEAVLNGLINAFSLFMSYVGVTDVVKHLFHHNDTT